MPTPTENVFRANRIIAQEKRKLALEKYYLNPNYCKFCGQVIKVKENESIYEVRKKKYCSKSCHWKSQEKENPTTRPRNKDRRREYCRKWYKKRREQWFTENGPCRKCGSAENLELHHTDPTKKVSHNIWSWSKERREAELAKCIILCKKCHQQETSQQKSRPIKHGTVTGYDRGCRCEECRKSHCEKMILYRLSKKAGEQS